MPDPDTTTESHAALMALLDRVGGRVAEEEVRYQITRRRLPIKDPLGDLDDLEQQGLVCGHLQFELTDAGRAAVRAAA